MHNNPTMVENVATDTLASQLKRKPIPKKLRFEVFKRDGFACKYCGAHPPNVLLEIDHIIPIKEGGNNDEGNLFTACFACNRGKGATALSCAPVSLAEKAKELEEREAQLLGYRDVMQRRLDRIEDDMWSVADALCPPESNYNVPHDWLRSIKMFNEKLLLHEVVDAAERAFDKKPWPFAESQRFKYFCGICWKKIRDGIGPVQGVNIDAQ
jgi:DNA-directed RNA polymerase subunit RPC12/RpoP